MEACRFRAPPPLPTPADRRRVAGRWLAAPGEAILRNAATPGELFVGDRHYGLRTNTGPRRLRVPSFPGYGISSADSRNRLILKLVCPSSSIRLELACHSSSTLL